MLGFDNAESFDWLDTFVSKVFIPPNATEKSSATGADIDIDDRYIIFLRELMIEISSLNSRCSQAGSNSSPEWKN